MILRFGNEEQINKWKWNYGRCNGRKKKREMRESLWNGRWIAPLGRMGASKMSGEGLSLEVHYSKDKTENSRVHRLIKHSCRFSLLFKIQCKNT